MLPSASFAKFKKTLFFRILLYSDVRILNLVLHPYVLQGKFDNALLIQGGPDQIQTTLSEANRDQNNTAFLLRVLTTQRNRVDHR